MSFKLDILTPDKWKEISYMAHAISFGKVYPPDFERIDFTILAVNNEFQVPMGFITVKEMNKNHIYWQYGGTFPGTKDTVSSYKIYVAARDLCAQSYKTISTCIENTNIAMLKFALKLGFLIVGVKHIFDVTYVELFLNLERV